jgi:hypothetical protein
MISPGKKQVLNVTCIKSTCIMYHLELNMLKLYIVFDLERHLYFIGLQSHLCRVLIPFRKYHSTTILALLLISSEELPTRISKTPFSTVHLSIVG